MPQAPKASVSGGVPPLLVLRSEAQRLLRCGIGKLRHLEQQGKLTPIKLTGGTASLVHYRFDQIEALARGEG